MDSNITTLRSIRPYVVATSFGFALVQLDVTIVNVALPRIAEALDTNIAGLQWVVDSYALCFAALLLSAGFLGDRFGARRVYLAGLAIFAAASLLCGCAFNAAAMIVARALQGVGAAAMMSCSLSLLNHAAERNPGVRAQAVGWWTASGSIAIAAGPIVGGLLLGLSGWRSIFLVNLPICAIAALLTLRVDETVIANRQGGFDLTGQALAIIALISVTAAIIEARPLGLYSALVWGSAVAGFAAGAMFFVAEKRSQHPMMPIGLFANRTFCAAVAYGVIANLTYYGIVFLLSLYLQRVLSYGPVQTGFAYLPLTATFFVVNIFSGWWVGRSGSRLPMAVGALIDASGFAVLLLLSARAGLATMLLAFALLPAGMGLGVPAMTTAVLASVDKQVSGRAAGALNAARQAGGAIGVAVFGAMAAGGGTDDIVTGLHRSALLAIVLLLLAALIAHFGLAPAGTAKASAAAGRFAGREPTRD